MLASFQFFQTYRGKILLVVFAGIQVPLIALVFLSGLSKNFPVSSLLFFGFILANAIATGVTLAALYKLLSPILVTSDSLSRYFQGEKKDHLPPSFEQEVNNLIVDTSEALGRLNGVIHSITNYDNLTGLPTREFFQNQILAAIKNTSIEQQFALIVLDLDSLKDVNSSLGRATGDQLLINVAQRLSKDLQPKDTLARFGGDEFIVLRSDIADHDNLITLSHDLLGCFDKPFTVGKHQLFCSAKIGITIYPLDGLTVHQLMQNADTAIYQAKQQSLNAYQFYSPSASDRLRRTLAIKENLRHALARNELYLNYQPRIEIATGKLVGVEALLRWKSPELGLVSPLEFIPIAEATKLIIPIGEWVLHHACMQLKEWQNQGLEPLRISVNLSACQFQQTTLIQTVDRILLENGLAQACLELEITESFFVEDVNNAIAQLTELKQRGISIALDDFGTGYSSLSYLQKLPIDTLKIDRSFVTNIATNPDDAAISRAIIALAQSLELKITAEGVENLEQLVYLQQQGCHEVQGYYFSRPLSAAQLQLYLETYQPSNTTEPG